MPEPVPVQPLPSDDAPDSATDSPESSASSNPGTDDAGPTSIRRRFRLNPRLLGKKWRKRTRWFFRIVLGGPLLLSVVVLVLMRSPIVGALARSAVEPLLGCKLSHSGAVISLDGRLIVDNLSMRVPDLAGKAGEFVSARRAEVDLDWSGLLSGQVRPTGVRLFEPVFRVSQSTTTGSVNLADLHPSPSATPRVSQPPRIDVFDGSIEFGEHTPPLPNTSHASRTRVPDSYKELTHMDIAGTLAPVDSTRPVYLIRFHENLHEPKTSNAASQPSPPVSTIGMVLDGKVDLDSSKASARLLNVRINGWPPDSVPTHLRDIWTRLNIQGRMPESTFSYDPVTGPEAEIKLDGVTMSALVPTSSTPGKSDDTLKLHGVVGSIHFASSTLIAELDAIVASQTTPSHVSLQYKGLSEDSALRCVITTKAFRLDKNPEWLAFTPLTVKENLAAFSGPTGLIDGVVVIERGPPTASGAADLTVTGQLDLSQGTAAFHRVPYPFKNIVSHVSFDQNKISIDRLSGSSDSGATITATGWIAPPDENAEISLHIVVKDIPLDHTFAESLPASRKEAISFLLSEEKYAALKAANLISTPADAAAARAAAPASTPPDAPPPEFELGGRAMLDITVHSPPGKDAPWTYTVLVSIPRAGFLASAFPWPVNATNVELKLTEDHAELLGGTFTGLRGGSLDLAAYVILETNGEADLRPDLHVRATSIPIDDVLLFALPTADPAQHDVATTSASPSRSPGDAPASTSTESAVAKVLRSLKLQGSVNCDASISPTPSNELALAMDLQFTDLTAGPFDSESSEPLSLTRLSGRIKLNQEVIDIPFIRGSIATGSSAETLGEFQLSANALLKAAPQLLTRPGDAKPSVSEVATTDRTAISSLRDLSASLELSNIDLTAPIESLLRQVSPSAADAVIAKRTTFAPTGHADAAITLSLDVPGTGASIAAELRAARNIELTAQGARVSFDTTPEGSASYLTHLSFMPSSDVATAAASTSATTPPAQSVSAPASIRTGSASSTPDIIALRDFTVRISSDTDAPLTLVASGELPLGPPQAAGDLSRTVAATGVVASIEHAQLGSCLIRTLLSLAVSSDTAATIDSFDPHGIIAANLSLTPNSSHSPPIADAPDTGLLTRFDIDGVIFPRSISLRLDDTRIQSDLIFGSIILRGTDVRTDTLSLLADDWSLTIQGGRHVAADGSASLDLGAHARATHLSPSIRELLPGSVRGHLDEAKLVVAGPIEITSARFTQSAAPPTAINPSPDSRLIGSFTFAGLSVDSALPVQDASGAVDLRLTRTPADKNWKFDANVRGNRMVVSGLTVSSLIARIVSGASPGEVIVPSVQADCYDGRITGSGLIGPSAVQPGDQTRPTVSPGQPPRGYAAKVSLAGIRFAPILEAFGTPTTSTPRPDPTGPAERGSVDATLTFSGIFGEPDSRQGLGSVRISGGDVVHMPLVLTLLQLSNFQLPAKDSLDFFQSSFRLTGGTIDFDQIALVSRTLAITGYGTMTWPGKELDLRFNSRASGRVPFLSDVVEAVRNEVATTRVKGTLMDPVIDAESLAGTKRMIDSAIGKEGGPIRTVTEADIDNAARRERDRVNNPKPNTPSNPPAKRP